MALFIYTAETNLGELLRVWMTDGGTTKDGAKEYLESAGIRVGNFDSWLAGQITNELATIFLKPFSDATGIDLDRLLMIEAKRRVLATHPAYAETLARFTNRSDVVGELKRVSMRYGDSPRLLAFQCSLTSGSLGSWFRGRHLPSGDMLDAALVAVGKGFLEEGVTCREDAILGVFTRHAFNQKPSSLLKELRTDGFKEIVRVLYRPFKDGPQSASAAEATGFSPGTGGRLSRWNPEEHRLPPRRVLEVLRALIARERPALLKELDQKIEFFLKAFDESVDDEVSATPPPPPAPAPVLPLPIPTAPPQEAEVGTPTVMASALASLRAAVNMVVRLEEAGALTEGDRMNIFAAIGKLMAGTKIDRAFVERLGKSNPIDPNALQALMKGHGKG